ncbi:flagellar basal body rod protein FlgC [Palleronia sp. LCG004]|uniref:flagellar basal body rod protein FlgC n=1 Tax=Palleronia sp. LCG004 TaxID=3079304 RepID=UPI0029429EDE|nr:flagellar basal body rod protein FlgC [Palleronia sp. LCG004]WOI56194.1 flagellar basal body rod protein FlgC [Palleronia sp. LCG004]
MADILGTLSISASGMQAQAERLRHTSENIANADTPGYRRKTMAFETLMQTGGVEAGRVQLSKAELPQIHDPAHPLADENGNYAGSNVDLIVEIADAREAQRSYDANLKMFDQARKMNQGLLELLRR